MSSKHPGYATLLTALCTAGCLYCAVPQAPDCHVVAVRITAEDAGDGFKPTAGRIEQLTFRPTPEVC